MNDPARVERDALLAAFAPPTPEAWRAAAEASLQGRPLAALTRPSYEGIPIRPLYTRADGAPLTHALTLPGAAPYVRGATARGYVDAPWLVAQGLRLADPSELNEALRHDLAVGQTAVRLLLDQATRLGLDPDAGALGSVGEDGTSLSSSADVAVIFAAVPPGTPLLCNAGSNLLPLLALFLGAGRVPQGVFGGDPLGALAHDGRLATSLPVAYDQLAAVIHWAAAEAPGLRTVWLDTSPYHEAGAHAGQELAVMLATGAAYLRALAQRGVAPATAAAQMALALPVGADFFMEIAKLRAARLLWSNLLAPFGVSDVAPALHARASARNKSWLDSHVNMLRATTEALAAALGGAQSIDVAPFDAGFWEPNELSRRVARNAQLILQDECRLTRLIDPGGGAWFLESLTAELAQRAWELFQAIEAQGGMAAALAANMVQADVAATAQARAEDVAFRRAVLVGVNMYPNGGDAPPPAQRIEPAWKAARRDGVAADREPLHGPVADLPTAAAAAGSGATLGQLCAALGGGIAPALAEPLRPFRAAAPFEALRRRALAFAERTGRLPRLHLTRLGDRRQHQARTDFSRAFFEVGGFEISTDEHGHSAAESAAAAALSAGGRCRGALRQR